MSIAIIGPPVTSWGEVEPTVKALILGITKNNIRIITGPSGGLNGMVRGILYKNSKPIQCERDADIVRIVAHSQKKRGLVAFINKPCLDTIKPSGSLKQDNIWAMVAYAVFVGVPVIVFLENLKPPLWEGGKWAIAGQGAWAAGLKWVKD